MTPNNDIRTRAKAKGVYLWEIANKLHVCEMTMTRKLRKELPDPEKQRIFAIIEEIAAEREAAACNS